MNKKIGVLLSNLGSPSDCRVNAVYRYLTQFLNDARVIDLPFLWRFILTNMIIVPFRSKKSAQAYQKIWTHEGSPLLVHSHALKSQVQDALGQVFQVEIGMRYGNPSIKNAMQKLQDCEKIIFLPLYPQYTSAATGSSIEAFMRGLSKQWNIPAVSVVEEFYNDPGFISAYARIIKEKLDEASYDMLLFSYHGLPERHIRKSACQAVCDHLQACPSVQADNRRCYRAQCFETTDLIRSELGIDKRKVHVSFQSRLGRTPWIKPYTDFILPDLAKKGIKKLAVVCPSFVADCLETLEEVNIRTREQWLKLGGTDFIFVPCLNSDQYWAKHLAEMVRVQIAKIAA